MRRTKIVATLGPASSDTETLKRLIKGGVDIFRLNFSHGTRDSHRETIHLIRETTKALGTEVAILQDLCGPKIRVDQMENDAVDIIPDSEVTITTKKVLGTSTRFSCAYKPLPRDVLPGNRILLDDGRLELMVLSASGEEVLCRVIRGGELKSRKGMNLPGTAISSPSVTQKDAKDFVVGLEEGVDFVALSFVRHPDDIRKVRRLLVKHGKSMQIIAKIEKPEAIEYIDEIIDAADGIMVARGDLGIEMELERVPILQKNLIRRANEADKYVITATQMLDSMMERSVPTRAEVADVANAIIDGTDAIMLSGETAAGEFPLEAVQTMDRIAKTTEAYLQTARPEWDWSRINPGHPVMDAVGHAAYSLYDDLDAKAIAAFTAAGNTALFLSKSRPFAPILAFTAKRETFRRMRIFWGVVPILDTAITARDELRARAIEHVRKNEIAEPGDRVLIVSGTHFGQIGATNGIEIATLDAAGNVQNTMRMTRNKKADTRGDGD